MRRLGGGLLLAGACGACWLVPLMAGLVGAGWLGAFDVDWPWAVGAGLLTAAALFVARRMRRRGRPASSCACPPA